MITLFYVLYGILGPSPRFRSCEPWTFRTNGYYVNIQIIFDSLEGIDFKYEHSFLKLQPKNTQTRRFWSQI